MLIMSKDRQQRVSQNLFLVALVFWAVIIPLGRLEEFFFFTLALQDGLLLPGERPEELA